MQSRNQRLVQRGDGVSVLGPGAARWFPPPIAAGARPWLMAQSWHDLLFAHWPVDPDQLRRLVPAPLAIDLFDDQAWLTVVAFRLSDVHLRGLPNPPGLSHFPEVNLRTYVSLDDRPGVLFLSLHCPNRFAIALARPWFRLPYHYARIQFDRGPAARDFSTRCADALDASSRSTVALDFSGHSAVALNSSGHGATALDFSSRSPTGATFAATYRPAAAARPSEPGSLAEFLTERYCYYAGAGAGAGAVYRCDVQHRPWSLAPAQADVHLNTLATPFGLDLHEVQPPVCHFAEHVDARIWPIQRVISRASP